jgi:hypothetical protein
MAFGILFSALSGILVVGEVGFASLTHRSDQDGQSASSQIPVRLSAGESDPSKRLSPEASMGAYSTSTPELIELLIRMIRHHVPTTYKDERKWDQRKEVWDGVHIRLSDGKLTTRRKTKEVRAGTWTRYSVEVLDPENRLHVTFDRLEPTSDGKMSFATTVEADLKVHGQLSQWARGVKLYSISADADTTIRLQVEGTVQLKINPFKFPPEMTVIPRVESAHLDVLSYRLRRVSHVGGDAAKLIGKSLRGWVDDRLEKENDRLADRMNRQLERRKHKMTVSAGDWFRSKRSSKKA